MTPEANTLPIDENVGVSFCSICEENPVRTDRGEVVCEMCRKAQIEFEITDVEKKGLKEQ